MSKPDGIELGLHVVGDARVLADEAADLVEAAAQQAARERGVFRIVLSGGTTPKILYRILDRKPRWGRIDWSRTEVFFGDERCVPPDHEQSNYRMAFRSLLHRVPLPEGAVHRIRGELDPAEAADLYERELREAGGGGIPVFDLVLLGLGEGGYTASLFPSTPAIAETGRLAVATEVPLEPRNRVTLTLPVFNAARMVIFLVAGSHKAEPLSWIVREWARGDAAILPAAMVRPANGRLMWLVDKFSTPFLRRAREEE